VAATSFRYAALAQFEKVEDVAFRPPTARFRWTTNKSVVLNRLVPKSSALERLGRALPSPVIMCTTVNGLWRRAHLRHARRAAAQNAYREIQLCLDLTGGFLKARRMNARFKAQQMWQTQVSCTTLNGPWSGRRALPDRGAENGQLSRWSCQAAPTCMAPSILGA